ncbi:MAG: ABC transporter permease [Chitinophagaceae bacterium]|nr:ABC transporter permease [Chitinophagaceae bacterium]
MLSLLKIEWMKVKNYRTFWILLAITVVSIPGINYMLYDLMDNSFPKSKGAQMILGSPFAFPDVWQTITWNSSLLFIIPALLVITLTTNEFTFKTHRQNVIDGWSRRQFIGVKLMEILLLAVFCTILVLLTVMGFGFIGNKLAENVSVWEHSRFIFFYFVQALSYLMIAFLLSMLIKRAGLSIGIFLIYMIVENVIVGILRNKYKVQGVNYMPEEVTDRLIPFPYARALLAKDVPLWEHLLPSFLIVALLYLLLYCFITGRRFIKSDL